MLATRDKVHVEAFGKEGKFEIEFKDLNRVDMEDIKFNGVDVFLSCDGPIDATISVLGFVSLFVHEASPKGQPSPQWVQDEVNLLTKEVMDWEPPLRNGTLNVDVDEKLIKSGDFFAEGGMDGLGAIIEYGTGSHISHSTMALWFEDEKLYIVESNADGIHRTPYQERVQDARNGGQDFMWIPLSDEMSSKFNETASR